MVPALHIPALRVADRLVEDIGTQIEQRMQRKKPGKTQQAVLGLCGDGCLGVLYENISYGLRGPL